jgi:hypothetical protein
MAYDPLKPAVADNYSTGYTQTIRDNFDFVLKLGEASDANLSITGTIPTGTKRYNPTNDVLEYYTGAAWATLPLDYLRKSGSAQECSAQTVFSASVAQPLQVKISGVTYGVWHGGNFDENLYFRKAGGTISGAVSIQSTLTLTGRVSANYVDANDNGLGRVTITTSTSAPSGGARGDIHVIY